MIPTDNISSSLPDEKLTKARDWLADHKLQFQAQLSLIHWPNMGSRGVILFERDSYCITVCQPAAGKVILDLSFQHTKKPRFSRTSQQQDDHTNGPMMVSLEISNAGLLDQPAPVAADDIVQVLQTAIDLRKRAPEKSKFNAEFYSATRMRLDPDH